MERETPFSFLEEKNTFRQVSWLMGFRFGRLPSPGLTGPVACWPTYFNAPYSDGIAAGSNGIPFSSFA